MDDLRDTLALVTGAGRGVGKAIALALAQAGCRVILAARTGPELEAVLRQIEAAGGRAFCVPTDLARDEEVQRLAESARRDHGVVDILINNAGWGKKSPILHADPGDWDRTFRVNLRAPMMLTKSVLPGMIERNSGAIVNIGSISGKTGEAGSAAYAASKFGLIGFTQSLYEEVRERGVQVSVILPGFIDTSMIPPVKHLDRARMIRPADVAAAVLFVLRSPATSCPVEITLRPQRTPYK
jgi:3-oxoacyl-[acyl-carrier protein] reductase